MVVDTGLLNGCIHAATATCPRLSMDVICCGVKFLCRSQEAAGLSLLGFCAHTIKVNMLTVLSSSFGWSRSLVVKMRVPVEGRTV